MSDHDLVSLFHRQWDLRYELSSHFLQKVKGVSMLDGDAGSVDTLRAIHEAIGVFLRQIEADCNIDDEEEEVSDMVLDFVTVGCVFATELYRNTAIQCNPCNWRCILLP